MFKIASLTLLLTAACVNLINPQATPPPLGPPVAPSLAVTTDALARIDEPLWNTYVQQIAADAARKPETEVLFLGDSITQGWRFYPELWSKHFGRMHPLNAGIWADGTQHLLWRVQHSDFGAISPKVVVLLIGVNNSHLSAVAIADGIAADVGAIRQRFAKAKILLLGILPLGKDPTEGRSQTCREVNRQIAALADDRSIFFWDLRKSFADDAGQLDLKLYRPDALHLSKAGYTAWGEALEPVLTGLWSRPPDS